MSPPTRAEAARLHALFCHTVIRANRANAEFFALVRQGLAIPLFRSPSLLPQQADFKITANGRKYAHSLFGQED